MPAPTYHSYLLRLWRESGETKPTWRIVLIDLTCKEEWGFTSFERLVTFLKKEMDELSISEQMPPDETENHTPGTT